MVYKSTTTEKGQAIRPTLPSIIREIWKRSYVGSRGTDGAKTLRGEDGGASGGKEQTGDGAFEREHHTRDTNPASLSVETWRLAVWSGLDRGYPRGTAPWGCETGLRLAVPVSDQGRSVT